ncbi:MAG: hypothetical protein ACR2M0_12375 [Chloroflexia bacterium]
MRTLKYRLAGAMLPIALLLLTSCGGATEPPTGTPLSTATAQPAQFTRTQPAPALTKPTDNSSLPTPNRQPAIRNPQSTAEPDDCLRSVGSVYQWYTWVSAGTPDAVANITKGLRSKCADDRRLAIWALGSVHRADSIPAIRDYIAAYPHGDLWHDTVDLTDLARDAEAYIAAPEDGSRTYAVDDLALFREIPKFTEENMPFPGPAAHVKAGTPLVLLGEIRTGQTRPDHGGETPLVMERVQIPNDPQTYYVDISPYVAMSPAYFGRPHPSTTQTPAPRAVNPQSAIPTATDEPDACQDIVGNVYRWRGMIDNYSHSDAQKVTPNLQSPCVESRWLAVWVLGSVRDRAALPSLEAYIAAHPNGDWLHDDFDVTAVARAAVAYINAPADPPRNYATENLPLYNAVIHYTDGVHPPDPVKVVPAGTPLTLMDGPPSTQSISDHGGLTPIVFRRVQVPGDQAIYYLDVSNYVGVGPEMFRVPQPPTP